MKLKGEHHCKTKFRNLAKDDGSENDGTFYVQIEYKSQVINVITIDGNGGINSCMTFEVQLDYAGAWLFTAGSGLN